MLEPILRITGIESGACLSVIQMRYGWVLVSAIGHDIPLHCFEEVRSFVGAYSTCRVGRPPSQLTLSVPALEPYGFSHKSRKLRPFPPRGRRGARQRSWRRTKLFLWTRVRSRSLAILRVWRRRDCTRFGGFCKGPRGRAYTYRPGETSGVHQSLLDGVFLGPVFCQRGSPVRSGPGHLSGQRVRLLDLWCPESSLSSSSRRRITSFAADDLLGRSAEFPTRSLRGRQARGVDFLPVYRRLWRTAAGAERGQGFALGPSGECGFLRESMVRGGFVPHKEDVSLGLPAGLGVTIEVTRPYRTRTNRAKMHPLRGATRHLRILGRATAHEVEKLMGSWSWALLLPRCAFAVPNQTYVFIWKFRSDATARTLPPPVLDEFQALEVLSHFFSAALEIPWAPTVFMLDSCNTGHAVTQRDASIDDIRKEARWAELRGWPMAEMEKEYSLGERLLWTPHDGRIVHHDDSDLFGLNLNDSSSKVLLRLFGGRPAEGDWAWCASAVVSDPRASLEVLSLDSRAGWPLTRARLRAEWRRRATSGPVVGLHVSVPWRSLESQWSRGLRTTSRPLGVGRLPSNSARDIKRMNTLLSFAADLAEIVLQNDGAVAFASSPLSTAWSPILSSTMCRRFRRAASTTWVCHEDPVDVNFFLPKVQLPSQLKAYEFHAISALASAPDSLPPADRGVSLGPREFLARRAPPPISKLWTNYQPCRITSRAKWRYCEHTNIQEVRTTVGLARRLSTCRSSWGHRYLVFTDSLTALGAVVKGRSSSYPLLRLGWQLVSACLPFDIKIMARYIPSGLNLSDWPSRGGPIGVAPETRSAHRERDG